MASSLQRWPNLVRDQCGRVESLLVEARYIPAPDMQMLVGEMLVIRIAQIIEENLPYIFCRILCGSLYLDGSTPKLLRPSRKLDEAIVAMLRHGRAKQKPYLKWLATKDIKDNVRFVLDASDNAVLTIDKFSSELDEIRIVRNHAAHRTTGTRKQYQTIIANYYGASGFALPVGRFVISERKVTPCPILRYTAIVRTLVKEICRE